MSDELDPTQDVRPPNDDQVAEAAVTQAAEAQEQRVVTVEAFEEVDFNAVISGLAHCATHALERAFEAAFKDAREENDQTKQNVCRLLAAICSITLTPDDRGREWGPMIVTSTWRSATPDDFRGEQSAVLESILARVEHPALRARLGDIVWTNHRAKANAAQLAVEAYCECAEGLLSGRYQAQFQNKGYASLELLDGIHRAFQLAYAIGKKGKAPDALPDRARQIWKEAYDTAQNENAFVVFKRLAELGLYYGLIDRAQVASDAEALASAAPSDEYAMAVKVVWDLGTRTSEQVGDKERKRRCQLGALDRILSMRRQVSGAGAEAYWVMQALQALNHITGLEDTELELLRDLRGLQKASLKEMKPFKFELDLKEDIEETKKLFLKSSLSDALFQFALLATSRPENELRQEALQSQKDHPIANLFAAGLLDNEGKTVSIAGAGSDAPEESWFLHTIDRSESIRRLHIVGGRIDPARTIIAARFGITDRHFHSIVGRCPFVPQDSEALVSLGFARFFQGDFMSAAYLLIPQLEPCLRYILKVNGKDPVKRYPNGTEEDMDLSNMLDRMSGPLEKILGGSLLFEVNRIFHRRPGLALRHEIAHGQVSAAACYHPDLMYACWFVYRLCVLFLSEDWDKTIAPELALEV